MTIQGFGLLLISTFLNLACQFLLKKRSIKQGKVKVSDFFGHIWNFIKTPELLASLACYALSTVVYFLVLTKVELSVAGPISAMTYIFTVALGRFVFHEKVSLIHKVGLGLIVCGIVLVSSS